MTDRTADLSMSRRTLLIGGGVLAATAAVGTRLLSSGPTALETLSAADLPTISVGFVDRVIVTVADLAGLAVTPAGDTRPGPAAASWRASVIGATPGFEEAVGDGAVTLETLFDNTTDEAWPFVAWTHRGGSAASTSGAVDLTMPSRPFGVGARLTVGAPDGGATTSSVVLSTQNRAGLPALREGTYLFGLTPSTWDRGRTLPTADATGAWSQIPSLAVSFRPA